MSSSPEAFELSLGHEAHRNSSIYFHLQAHAVYLYRYLYWWSLALHSPDTADILILLVGLGFCLCVTECAPSIWSGTLSLSVLFCCNYDRQCLYVCTCQQGDPEYHINSKFVYQSFRSPCSPVPLSLSRRSFLGSSWQLLVYPRQSPELA